MDIITDTYVKLKNTNCGCISSEGLVIPRESVDHIQWKLHFD